MSRDAFIERLQSRMNGRERRPRATDRELLDRLDDSGGEYELQEQENRHGPLGPEEREEA